jgi:hypothetical protein
MNLYFKAESEGAGNFEYNKTYNNPFTPSGFTPLTNVTLANQIRHNPIVIEEDLEITAFSINIPIGGGVVGALVCGLYDSVDGFPDKLLFQNVTPFDTNVTGIQTETLATPYKLKAGVYFKAHHANSAPTLRLIPIVAHHNVLGDNNGFLNGIYTEYRTAATYTGTLPATAANGGNVSISNSIYINFDIQ